MVNGHSFLGKLSLLGVHYDFSLASQAPLLKRLTGLTVDGDDDADRAMGLGGRRPV